ncbi:hypothetical protein COV82_06050 [Candidatus Peregrinibacteria bacterium CG11_big_fil_rev_8_21_14_0_20_46_8]|nr:MAG: hypothetical protein COV82_06050 [Candidatus Peregrinibacteria bacterium CG11_big_fil_rev_8_21_14_0_20_46_8]
MFYPLFLIQLATSFIIGGALIALLSFVAERADERIAGIIISLPSTVAISYFFIGWAVGPQAVAEAAPLAPLVVGIIMLFTIVYLYLSKIRIRNKGAAIALCIGGATSVWLLLAIPLAVYKFNNLLLSLGGYIVLALFAYYFITVRPQIRTNHVRLHYTFAQKLGRAAFAGAVITFTVFLSKTLGPFWGGIFSMFPAVYLSSFIILHWHYDSDFLFKVWKKTPLGTLAFTIYPVAAIYTFPAFGVLGGTIGAYAISLLGFFAAARISR